MEEMMPALGLWAHKRKRCMLFNKYAKVLTRVVLNAQVNNNKNTGRDFSAIVLLSSCFHNLSCGRDNPIMDFHPLSELR